MVLILDVPNLLRGLMAKFNCVDCGIEIASKVKKPYNRRCPACTETFGPMVPSNSGYKVIREEVGVQELKATPPELIHML